MADRIPLIYNSTDSQIQELPSADNLDLTSSGIVGVTSITASTTITAADFNSTSDINYKTNIQPIGDPISKVLTINGVTFNWKQSGKTSAGVIAQDVEVTLPELVENNQGKTVNYNGLIGLLVEVVKQQNSQIEELKTRIEVLESK
jgi:hypothetical protein